ncbi:MULTISPECIES: bifunctional DNA primase/polymerase [unclassified Streptomyces]|uniref:bifunctional DNA primase/polymerase n=1 Tax=unclassified Streptomyces TaxID=2593676 RepID=UPI000DBAAB8F|nr:MULTISPECIES: bifunctional DNA primase/polymerase [unclassified Streptomyces]MYT70730.1 DNA primase [Streptomyces sp. SID8367]RAJ90435.1 bifunctional DNA primase/polymerase-like protein [Streptomyces sp. PsTaAH-137]
MTHPALIRRDHLSTALRLAADGLPVLPLRKGKLPFANCPACLYTSCGGRPHMKTHGPCTCLAPCHGWAAATTDPWTLNSPCWAAVWQEAAGVAYYPGGAGLTVVDLDHDDAVVWARATLPATRTVRTTRGQHWIYQGTMPSSNGVRDGVDIKSTMAYARWRGPGCGALTALPFEVRALAVKEPAPVQPVPHAFTGHVQSATGACRHRSPAFLERGIAMAVQRINEASTGIHAAVYATFLAVLSVHGRCGCLTEDHIARLFTVAQAKGESARHCSDAWSNALTRLGL